ncbi:MAG: peptidylprolyl isomerase [Bdellovibrionales bacterium]|nr:peptidylprolyl isomerase [Bdellovibrionales bacterium]
MVITSPFARAELIERIVAIVDNAIVTKTDLEAYREKLKSGGLVDDALLKMKDPKALMSDDNALVSHLVDERVIDQEIQRLGMAVTIEKVEQEIRSVTSRNGITRAQLKEALTARGVKFSDYQDFIRTSLERQALIDREVASRIKISEEDISNFYLAQTQQTNAQVFEYRLAHILIRPVERGGQSPDERIKLVQRKVSEGTRSFSELASQFSEDPNFSQGGILGSFKAGEMLPALENGIRSLNVGDISQPVKTPAGLHIIKVINKTLVEDPNLKAQKVQIQNILYARAFKDQFRKWLDQKRENSFIRINEQ